MALAEHDDMIEQIAAAVADKAPGNTVLPRTFERRSDRLDPNRLHGLHDVEVEDSIAVVDQVFRGRVKGKRFAQLLGDPGAGWVARDVEIEHAPPVVGYDEEAVEHAKGKRRNGEEIHGGNGFAVVLEKRRPSLGRLGAPRDLSHPTQDGSFRNIETQHLQLTMNARRTPCVVLCDHAEDEFAQFPAHTFFPREVDAAKATSSKA
jgi:hypothetical protein